MWIETQAGFDTVGYTTVYLFPELIAARTETAVGKDFPRFVCTT